MTLIDKIIELKKNNSLLKHEQLVQGVIESIDEGVLQRGDQLPSINKMVSELGYARKTIVKAYEELKKRGLVESKKLKGYFIVSEETKVILKLALVLFAFERFQEDFYNTFRKKLGGGYQIDVFFHHNNISVFETIFSNIQGKYGMYVVAPIPSQRLRPLLKKVEPQKLLIIDRYLSLGQEYSYISQEFEENTYNKLVELLPQIKKYKKFVLFYKEDSAFPIGILNAFSRFLADYNVPGGIVKGYKRGSIKKGNLYYLINDTFLLEVLRDCMDNEYTLGRNIGILSQNDHVVKQIAFGGITTISVDFKDMARKAAYHIKQGEKTQIIMPFKLIMRNSL